MNHLENATIIYLVKSTEESFLEIKESILLLVRNFLVRFPYPVTIFMESDFYDDWQSEIKNIYHNITFSSVIFEVPCHNAHLDIPEYFPHPTHANGPIAWGHPGFDMGYRHMCRFMSGEIFKNPVLTRYEWFMRLDTDSFILSELRHDLFKIMASAGKLYGYNNIQDDNLRVVMDLYEESERYFSSMRIVPKSVVQKPKIFYTNFEICNITWFSGNHYMDFYNHIDKIGGIYTKRWGDAPIRYIAVKTLLEPCYIIDFSPLIDYRHGSHRKVEKQLTYNVQN